MDAVSFGIKAAKEDFVGVILPLGVASLVIGVASGLMGFVVGVAGLSLVAIGTDLYWPWYAAVGSLITWFAGWLIQLLMPAQRVQ